jgi:hypothetical protein
MTPISESSECAHSGCDQPVVARILGGDQRVWELCQDHLVATVSRQPAFDSTITIDTATVSSDWVRELLYLTEQREQREQQQRAEVIGRASMLLDRPTIGAYRRHNIGIEL